MSELGPEFDEIKRQLLESIGQAGVAQPREQGNPNPKVAGSTPAASAIAYARRGMAVFPCHNIDPDGECSCGKVDCQSAGKHPRYKDWQQSATTDEQQIRHWWAEHPNANIGVACGQKSHLTVLDVDGEVGRGKLRELELEHGELPETPIALTGSGGCHYYFRHAPGVGNAVRFADGLDVRTDGGLVVGVGSKTKRIYEWEAIARLGEVELAEMPQWLVDLIRAHGSVNGNGKLATYKVPDLRKMVENSGRNDVLYRLGRSLRATVPAKEAIEDALIALNGRFPRPLDDRELATIIANVLAQPDREGFDSPAIVEPRDLVGLEDFDAALLSNEEYLKREAIVANLYYEQAISLTVGGKHEGKTTLTRTEALKIAAGDDMYGRTTVQTPVLYAASDDEYPTTRMELLRMGWQSRRLPLRLVKITSQDADPEEILAAIARLAEAEGSRYVVLDMLFDFISIQDEIKYAQTRRAVGHIQTLATTIGGHVKATHHSPKWMLDVTTAAKAALGSMGIVARFSPIVLCRKWADDLFTVESTLTRDPRGLQIKPTLVTITVDGWADATQPFQAWMKWRAYADRIIGLFQGEPDKSMSVSQVVEALEISRVEVQNALYQMTLPKDGVDGLLIRYKVGKKYLYRLSDTGAPDLFRH